MRRWGFVQASVFWMNGELANNEHRDQPANAVTSEPRIPGVKNERKKIAKGAIF
jgi:hypothetical protein